MSPVSMLMIHNPSTAVWGDSEEMKKAIKTLDEVKESIINAYKIKTGLSRDKISHMMDAETWMNANKAVELGFADKILFEQEQEGGETVAMAFTPMTVTNSIRSKVALKEPVKEEHRVSADALEQRLNLLRH
jgi:ATP-dependent Clp protease protease subunit